MFDHLRATAYVTNWTQYPSIISERTGFNALSYHIIHRYLAALNPKWCTNRKMMILLPSRSAYSS